MKSRAAHIMIIEYDNLSALDILNRPLSTTAYFLQLCYHDVTYDALVNLQTTFPPGWSRQIPRELPWVKQNQEPACLTRNLRVKPMTWAEIQHAEMASLQ